MSDGQAPPGGRRAGILPPRAVELLAPARDLECGVAALLCGADALYIGAPRFGARAAAGRPLDEIALLLREAHFYHARVYAAVNTLLTDEELPQAVELIGRLAALGVDGIIIQDPGLLACQLPPLPLIASTQMDNRTPEKAAFLEKVGFARAILARELTLAEIREVRAATSLELEVFVHGALCVGESGRCTLSFALGGRSANRGECAQPCRLPYSLEDGQGRVLLRDRHLLSLRDLDLSGCLGELLDAGVTSFKIEGRLKDRAYAANITAHYRQALDPLLRERGLRPSSSGASRPGFPADPLRTFHRGSTTYFLHGRGASLASHDTPKAMGPLLAKVERRQGMEVTLDRDAPLTAGDGLAWLDGARSLRGGRVETVHGRRVRLGSAEGVEEGTELHRNLDHAFLAELERARPERTVAVRLSLAREGEGLLLRGEDEDGVTGSAFIPGPFPPAREPGKGVETIRRQLGKAGGSGFTVVEARVEAEPVPFLPLSSLNRLRRELLEALAEERRAAHPRAAGGVLDNDAPYPERELDFRGLVLNRRAEEFYRRHGVERMEPAAESGIDLSARPLMTCRMCLREELGWCLKQAPGAQAPPGPLVLVHPKGNRLALSFDCAHCRMEVWRDEG